MIKKIIISLVILISIIAILAGIKYLQISSMIAAGKNAGPYPESVEIQDVRTGDWEVTLHAIGSVEPKQGTMVRVEVDGIVKDILYEAGSTVNQDEELVLLDNEVELARYNTMQAAKDLAELNLKRSRELFQRNSISQSEFDTVEATYKGAKAELMNAQAVLNKKTIKAPFTGQLGVKLISLGDYLNRGDAVVSLQAMDEVFINFSISQQELSFAKKGYEVIVKTDTWPNRSFKGVVTAMNPQLNPSTRTVEIQATLKNEDHSLRPGMFVSVSVIKPEKRAVIYVPQTAILNATYGDTLFAVKSSAEGEMLKVEERLVRLGEKRGDFVEILSGVKGNEQIVTSGAFKLNDGSLINPSSKGVLEPSLNPEPTDG